jgi:hypothetical protein
MTSKAAAPESAAPLLSTLPPRMRAEDNPLSSTDVDHEFRLFGNSVDVEDDSDDDRSDCFDVDGLEGTTKGGIASNGAFTTNNAVSGMGNDATSAGGGVVRDEEREVRAMAQKETHRVWLFKFLVLVTILIAAGVVSAGTYLFLEEEDDDDFADSVRACSFRISSTGTHVW